MYKILEENKIGIIIGIITSLIFYILSVIIPEKYVKSGIYIPYGIIIIILVLALIYIKYNEDK
ncbi:hypothetical protein, partial [Terrisporobacter petrolearius]|uniref:hypothetical protein n=1 Tax=Terrisporobacter petrolearius TaxID=1460447 RepID=UPI0022E137A8